MGQRLPASLRLEKGLRSAFPLPPAEEFVKAYELGAVINLDDIGHIPFLEKALNGKLPELICFRYNPGPLKKGNAIIQFLKEKKVNVIVSMQFGRNIKMVNQHFVPIIIYQDDPADVIEIVNKHLHWINDEWQNKKTDYNLFTIKFGVLKSKID